MAKYKVLVFFIIFFIANNAIAQSIDTISIKIDFPYAYNEAYCTALKITGTDTIEFTDAELDTYSFKWSGSYAPELDSLSSAVYSYISDANYSIALSVTEIATSDTIRTDTAILIQVPANLVIPNVFTPNDDGVNDLFKIFYDGVNVLEITIFTQTGTEVFAMKAPSIVWDGRNSSGAKVSPGIYYYVLTSESTNIEPQSGFIHIYFEN